MQRGTGATTMNLTNEQIEQILDGAPANDWTHYCTRNRQYFKRDGNTDRLFVWLSVTKTWSIPLENKVRWLERRERLEEILTLRQRVQELEQLYSEAIKLLDAAVCPCCDKSGAYYDNNGEVCQCQWCDEVSRLPQPPKENDDE